MQIDEGTLARIEVEFAGRTEITALAAARIIGVHEKTLRQWAADGGIGSRQTPGGRRVFTKWHILDYCERDACPSKSDKTPTANGRTDTTSTATRSGMSGAGARTAAQRSAPKPPSASPSNPGRITKKRRASLSL